jgi:YegS/Rv2252/BmrU family lipid kinase
MDRKIIYLINPISGTQGKSSVRALIKKRTKEAGIDFDLMSSNAAGQYDKLHEKIRHERITDVVVCGGDGTINAIASTLKGMDLNLGIIPMGSGNGLAFTAKIPSQPSRALDIIFRGQASYIDAFMINNRFSCMLCGIGFDASVAHAFASEKRRGLQTYIKTSLVEYFKAQPYPFMIELPEKKFNTEAFFISIANSNQFGNNFTIAPQASLNDGLLDIVIVKKMSKLILPFSMISQVTGINALQSAQDYTGETNIIYLQTPSVNIQNPKMAPLHIDGDPQETEGEFKIKIIRKCFRLLQ